MPIQYYRMCLSAVLLLALASSAAASPKNTKTPIGGVDDTAVKEKAHPLQDIGHSGINWVFPFEKARQQAEEEKRLLLIIPITGVKVTAKGDW